MFGENRTSQPYASVQQHDSQDASAATWSQQPKKPAFKAMSINPWAVSNIVLSIIVFALLYRSDLTSSKGSEFGSFDKGYTTEMLIQKPPISTHKVRFRGDLHFHENGTSYLHQEPGQRIFVGPPTPEIDMAWMDTIGRRYFWIKEDVAQSIWGPSYNGYYEGDNDEKRYLAGLDVLHALHCLNTLRQLLDADQYPHVQTIGRAHNYHCVDHIRQYLMCHADLTPIPAREHPAREHPYADAEQLHTCRNFNVLLEWIGGLDLLPP